MQEYIVDGFIDAMKRPLYLILEGETAFEIQTLRGYLLTQCMWLLKLTQLEQGIAQIDD